MLIGSYLIQISRPLTHHRFPTGYVDIPNSEEGRFWYAPRFILETSANIGIYSSNLLVNAGT